MLLRRIVFFVSFSLGILPISYAQLANPDSIIHRSLLKTSEHASLLKNFKFKVLVSEKTRFNDILGIGEKRLEKIEGVREDQWYGHSVISEVYSVKLNQSIHEIKQIELLNKKSAKPTLFFWPDFYQDIVGPNCISPLNFQSQFYYTYQFKKDTLIQSKKGYLFQLNPKSSLDRLFKGQIVLSEDGALMYVNLAVFADALNYKIELKHQFALNTWLPLEGNFVVNGGLLGNNGEFHLNEKVVSPPENWSPTNENLLGNSIIEKLNIAERAFDEVYVSQLLGNLHNSMILKWKDRSQSGITTIDSTRLAPNFLIKNQIESNLSFFNQTQNSREAGNTALAYYEPVRKAPLAWQDILFSRSFYFGAMQKDFYPYEIYYKAPIFDTNFNTAEGFVSNSGFLVRKRWARYHFIEAEAIGRHSFLLNRNTGYLKLRYKTEKFDIQLTKGDFVAQYNSENSISPEMNSLSTLLLKNNQMKIYRKDFWSLYWINRISSTLFFKGNLELADRSQMDNVSDYYWINYLGRKFTSNNPTNAEFSTEGFQSHRAFTTQFTLGFRPFLDHAFEENERINNWGSSPLMLLKYRAGWSNVFGSTTDFNHLEFSYVQNVAVSPWVKLGLVLNAGTFFGKKPSYFIDFKHFNGNINLIQASDMLASHRLVGYYQNFTLGANQRLNVNHYSNSTAGNYLEGLSFLQFTNLWLKPMLGIKQSFVKEVLIANVVWVPNQNLLYREIGYGLDGIFKVLRLEAIASFNNAQFSYIGLRLNINSRIRVGNVPE
ncbi:MAG: DUF5686 family protein [Aquirufa sp.]